MLENFIQLHREGRFAEAERGYRGLLAENPENAAAMHMLGILRGQRGDMPEALQLVQCASELEPESATCQHTLAEMYLSQGRVAEAAAAYDSARKLNPNLAGAHGGLGRIAALRGDLDAAEEHFKAALRADEDDVQALTGLGNAAQLRRDSGRALQWFKQAAELAPDDPQVQTGYAQAMLEQGTNDFAAKALENALSVRPDYPLAQALRAELHVREGRAALALPIYESLLARGEEVAAVRAGLGDIARLQGRQDTAIAQYDEALRLAPGLHPAVVRRANTLAANGRIRQAIDDLRAHMAAYPDAMQVWETLAKLLAQMRRFDEALAVWQAAEVRWPDDLDLKAQHALTLDHAGRADEALALADIAAASTRPAVAMLRARGALLAGDPAAAVQRLERIEASRFEGRPRRLFRRHQRLLGLAFDALEQWPVAVETFITAQPEGAAPPELPPLESDDIAQLQHLAAAPVLAEPRGNPPVLLCGLPGSGVARIAALLADQPGWFVRRERFTALVSDPVSMPFDERFLQPLDQAALGLCARRYQRQSERVATAATSRIADWIPVLDARVVPVLRRALPGLRVVIARRELHDTLLHWLAFGSAHGYGVPDQVAGAHWLRRAGAHLAEAAALLPALYVDSDALIGVPDGDDARQRLGEFLGIAVLAPGPATRAAGIGRGGLPAGFAAGHARHYREVLPEAFAVLDEPDAS
jgi:tetratricopeptide (TPR) repeat protein